MSRPLRFAAAPPPVRAAPGGWWTATVTAVTPSLSVNVPQLAGPDSVIADCRSAVFSTPLAIGDPVYVTSLDGLGGVLVVCARRNP